MGIDVGNVVVIAEIWFKMVNLLSIEAKFFFTMSFRVCTSYKMFFSGE